MPTTPIYDLRYPAGSDAPNGPVQIQNLAEDVEGVLGDGFAAWMTYTPAWTASTNPTIGNGTKAGRYCRVGNTVHLVVRIDIGSTTTAGVGAYSVSLPTGLDAASDAVISGYFYDVSGPSHYSANGVILATDSVVTNIIFADEPWSNTSPDIAADGDYILISGTYETA